MPVLRNKDRIPKVASPADVRILLTACAGDQPEDLRDRALVWTIYSAGIRAGDAANLTIPEVDLATGILDVEDGKGDKDRQAFVQEIAAGYLKAYLERGRTPLLERMPKRRGPVAAGETNLLQTDLVFLSSRGRAGEIGLGDDLALSLDAAALPAGLHESDQRRGKSRPKCARSSSGKSRPSP